MRRDFGMIGRKQSPFNSVTPSNVLFPKERSVIFSLALTEGGSCSSSVVRLESSFCCSAIIPGVSCGVLGFPALEAVISAIFSIFRLILSGGGLLCQS